MTNIANKQLFELSVLLVAAIVYIVGYFGIKWLAVLISGRKSGVIRGFLQGTLLVGLLAITEICFFNGNLKVYHLVAYFGIVFVSAQSIKLIKDKILIKKKTKKKEENS